MKNGHVTDGGQLPRTRSDAVASTHNTEALRMKNKADPSFRRRSKSRDSIDSPRLRSTVMDSEEEGEGEGRGEDVAGVGGMMDEVGVAGLGRVAGLGSVAGTEGEVGVAGVGSAEYASNGQIKEKVKIKKVSQLNRDLGHTHLRVKDQLSLRKSRSSDDLTAMASLIRSESPSPSHTARKTTPVTSHCTTEATRVPTVSPDHVTPSPEHMPDHMTSQEFCLLTYAEPDDLITGGEYTFILDECDDYLSDDDIDDHSSEVKDLTPMDSPRLSTDGREGSWKGTTPINPPRASRILLNAFQQRLENIMMNIVDYPPALFFVQ